MGQTSNTKCLDCGHKFELDQGGGFTFHLLRCNSCDRQILLNLMKLVSFICGAVNDYYLHFSNFRSCLLKSLQTSLNFRRSRT